MQTKDRPPRAGLLQIYITMLLNDAIYYREPKADSIGFLGTYKRLKERLSNGGRHSTAAVDHTNVNKALVLSNRDLDYSRRRSEPRSLAGIEQKVINSATKFCAIHPVRDRRPILNHKVDISCIGVGTDHANRMFNHFVQGRPTRMQWLACFRKK
jgi:hypothetical protein